MADDNRREREIKAVIRQLKSKQAQTDPAPRRWRLDVPLTTLAWQGGVAFLVGFLVGLGLFVLQRVLLT